MGTHSFWILLWDDPSDWKFAGCGDYDGNGISGILFTDGLASV